MKTKLNLVLIGVAQFCHSSIDVWGATSKPIAPLYLEKMFSFLYCTFQCIAISSNRYIKPLVYFKNQWQSPRCHLITINTMCRLRNNLGVSHEKIIVI